MRLANFSYSIEHIPGQNFWAADALSRAPLKIKDKNNADILDEKLFIDSVIDHMMYSYILLERIWQEQLKDIQSQNLLTLKSSRIFIPFSLRKEMLKRMHSGHPGIVNCRRRAQKSMWWPNLSNDLNFEVENCRICIGHRINKPEPLIPTELPKRPWVLIGVDLMDFKNKKYLDRLFFEIY